MARKRGANTGFLSTNPPQPLPWRFSLIVIRPCLKARQLLVTPLRTLLLMWPSAVSSSMVVLRLPASTLAMNASTFGGLRAGSTDLMAARAGSNSDTR